MNITVNGKLYSVISSNLADLLIELDYSGKIATALNESFIPSDERPNIFIKEGDRLEIVAPMEGG